MDHRSVPDLHRNQSGLRHADRGDLVEWHMASIGFDLNRIEQTRRGPTRAQSSQLLPQQLDRDLHAALELIEIVRWVCHGDPSIGWSSCERATPIAAGCYPHHSLTTV